MPHTEKQIASQPDFGSIRDDLEQHPRLARGALETTAATGALIGTSLFGPAVGLLPYGAYRAWRAFSSNRDAQENFVDPRNADNVHPTPLGHVVDTGNDSYAIESIDKQRRNLMLRKVVPQVIGGLSVAALSVIGPTSIYNGITNRGGEMLLQAMEIMQSNRQTQLVHLIAL